MPTKSMLEFQYLALAYMRRIKHPVLFMRQRMGKTIVAINRCIAYPNYEKNNHLIIGPISAALSWEEELRELGVEMIYLYGTPKRRMRLLDLGLQKSGPRWFFINHDGPMCIPAINDVPWNVVILDEATVIMNPRALITKWYLSRFRSVDHRFIFTGTPTGTSKLDMITQLNWVDPAILEYQSYWAIRARYCRQIAFDWEFTKSGLTWLQERLAKYCLFLEYAQCGLDYNPIVSVRKIIMPDNIRVLYNQFELKFLLEYKNLTELTKTAPVRTQWMRRLVGGFVKHKAAWHGKLNDLLELLGNLTGRQTVICASYLDEIKAINKKLTSCGYSTGVITGDVSRKQRDVLVKQFRNKELGHLVINPACMKYGANLSTANDLIYFTLPESHITKDQTDLRIWNMFKTEPITIHILVVQDTIDESILAGLNGACKRRTILSKMVTDIKRRHRNVCT